MIARPRNELEGLWGTFYARMRHQQFEDLKIHISIMYITCFQFGSGKSVTALLPRMPRRCTYYVFQLHTWHSTKSL